MRRLTQAQSKLRCPLQPGADSKNLKTFEHCPFNAHPGNRFGYILQIVKTKPRQSCIFVFTLGEITERLAHFGQVRLKHSPIRCRLHCLKLSPPGGRRHIAPHNGAQAFIL